MIINVKSNVYIRGGDPQAHGKAGGYFQLGPKTLIPLVSFARSARYRPRFDFPQRVVAAAAKAFGPAMLVRFAEAVRTRR